jgi:hypothetical protein
VRDNGVEVSCAICIGVFVAVTIAATLHHGVERI